METPTWLSYAITWVGTAALIILSSHLLLSRRIKLKLPPGPKPWPIIGNLTDIGPLAHRSFHALAQKYGPLMYVRFGSFPVIVATSVDMAVAILKTHDITFANRPKTAAGKYTTYNYNNITWSDYGPYWRQARKICLSELFSPKRLDQFEYIRVEEINDLLKDLYLSAGKPVVVKDRLIQATLNIIGRMVLGKRFMGEKADTKNDIMTQEEIKEIFDELFFINGVVDIGDSIPWLAFLDLQGYVKRMKILGQKFNTFMEHVVSQHEKRRRGIKGYEAKDMVDVLLDLADDPNLEVKLGRDGVKAFAQDMIAGGTETPSVTIEWTMAELLKYPENLEKATEELDRVIGRERWVGEKDIADLPFINAICKEAMRLHPVAPLLIPRFTYEQIQIGGYDIPAGARALINVWAIGRDPTLWDKPNEFHPERFLGKSIDVKGQHYELLPFGSGRRMCPGYALGLKEIQSSVANLLHGFKWRLPDNMTIDDLSLEEGTGLSMPKKDPVVAVIAPRLPSHLYSL